MRSKAHKILPRNGEWFPYGSGDTAKTLLDGTQVRFPYGITPRTGAWPGGAEQSRDYLQTPKAGAVSHVSHPGSHSIRKCGTYSAIKHDMNRPSSAPADRPLLTLWGRGQTGMDGRLPELLAPGGSHHPWGSHLIGIICVLEGQPSCQRAFSFPVNDNVVVAIAP